jgi:glutamyl-tRNA synthetase
LGARLEASEEFTEASVEAELRKVAEEKGLKAGILINGARAALTGQSVGPSAFHVFTALGKDRSVKRLQSV